MSSLKKDWMAFRPSLTGARLEDRVVLNGAGAQIAATRGGMTVPQVRQAFQDQFRTAANDLRQFTNSQISTLFANGTPTRPQVADLRTQLNGALNANALRLSSSAALLPNGNQRLVPRLQQNLLGTQKNGLNRQLDTIFRSSKQTRSALVLQKAVDTALDRVALQNSSQLNTFIAHAGLNRNSVVSGTFGSGPLGMGMPTPPPATLSKAIADRLGPALTTIYQEYMEYQTNGSVGTFTSSLSGVIRVQGNSVGVDLRPTGNIQTYFNEVTQQFGMVVEATTTSPAIVEGLLPINQLANVMLLPDTAGISAIYRPITR